MTMRIDLVGLITLTCIIAAVVPGSASYMADKEFTASVGVFSDAAMTVPVADTQDFGYSLVKEEVVVKYVDGIWVENSSEDIDVTAFTASTTAPYTGTIEVAYLDEALTIERSMSYSGGTWWVFGQSIYDGIPHRLIYRYVISDVMLPAGYVPGALDGVRLVPSAWSTADLNYQKVAGGAVAEGGRSYNQRGAVTLGDGEFQVIDGICGFTQYLTVTIAYKSGVLNDVTYAYEHGNTVDQWIRYGGSSYNLILNNPTGKMHIQAMKWSGDHNNQKPISITVTDWKGNVVYKESTTENLLDVSLTLKGCTVEEFNEWMATH